MCMKPYNALIRTVRFKAVSYLKPQTLDKDRDLSQKQLHRFAFKCIVQILGCKKKNKLKWLFFSLQLYLS